MTRRLFLSTCAAGAAAFASLWLALRSRCRPETDVAVSERERGPGETGSPARDAEAVAEFIRGRILDQMPPALASEFDPITLITVVGLVIQVLQVCGWSSIARQQQAVRRRPTGQVAMGLRRRLAEKYLADHPQSDLIDAHNSVAFAIHAFEHADSSELRQLHADVVRLKDSPTPIDLFEFSESLSGLRE
jgi:hypothetical protein